MSDQLVATIGCRRITDAVGLRALTGAIIESATRNWVIAQTPYAPSEFVAPVIESSRIEEWLAQTPPGAAELGDMVEFTMPFSPLSDSQVDVEYWLTLVESSHEMAVQLMAQRSVLGEYDCDIELERLVRRWKQRTGLSSSSGGRRGEISLFNENNVANADEWAYFQRLRQECTEIGTQNLACLQRIVAAVYRHVNATRLVFSWHYLQSGLEWLGDVSGFVQTWSQDGSTMYERQR